MLAGEPIARADLAWIGLGVGEQAAQPGSPPDPAADALQVGSGALQTAPLLGIDASTVVTARGSHSRAAVDWIYLAPRPDEPDGVSAAAQPDDCEPTTGTGLDPPPQPPPDDTTVPGADTPRSSPISSA